MSVYLAGPLHRREEIRGYADQLISNGIEVSSRWVWAKDDPQGTYEMGRLAMRNVNDLLGSDLVFVFTGGDDGTSKGGHHVEFGFAYGLHALGVSHVELIGDRNNIFHEADGVKSHENWAQALASLLAHA